MKKRSIVTALALTLAIGMGATAYAASSESTAPAQGQRLGLGRITAMRGYDYITDILKNKLGLSDADVKSALDSGKTPYEIASEKGLNQDELKKALLEERGKSIDDAVSKGTITKEQAEDLKQKLEANIESCQGNFGQRRGLGQGMQGRGQGRGMMGNGQGRGCLGVPTN
jgi:ribosomal protein S20